MFSGPYGSTDSSDADQVVDYAALAALAGRAVDALPPGSPAAWRGPTYRAVLSAVIKDRIENGTADLEEGDVTSLTDFVLAAAGAAAAAGPEFRDDAYQVVLEAQLEDWVENWNEPDDDDS
jgi:hypothetical protein